RPERVVRVLGELQVMRREAGVDERVFAALGLVNGEVPARALGREELRGRVIGAGLAERRLILRRADRSGVPDPALVVEHRIVGVRAAVPDRLVAPVRGGL